VSLKVSMFYIGVRLVEVNCFNRTKSFVLANEIDIHTHRFETNSI